MKNDRHTYTNGYLYTWTFYRHIGLKIINKKETINKSFLNLIKDMSMNRIFDSLNCRTTFLTTIRIQERYDYRLPTKKKKNKI